MIRFIGADPRDPELLTLKRKWYIDETEGEKLHDLARHYATMVIFLSIGMIKRLYDKHFIHVFRKGIES